MCHQLQIKESISCKLSTKTSSWYSPTMTDHKLSHHRRQSVNCRVAESFWKIELILHEWFWYTSDMKKIFPSIRFANSWKEKVLSWCPFDQWIVTLEFFLSTLFLVGLKFYPAFKCKIPFNKFTQNLSPTPPHIMRGVFFGQGLSVGLELSPPPCFSEHMITPH